MAADPCLPSAEDYDYLIIISVWHRVPILPSARNYELFQFRNRSSHSLWYWLRGAYSRAQKAIEVDVVIFGGLSRGTVQDVAEKHAVSQAKGVKGNRSSRSIVYQ